MAKKSAAAVSSQEPALPPEIAKLSFEEALDALETLVQEMESGELPLEASIEAYGRGTQLRQHCENTLKSARLKVEQILQKSSGNADTELDTTPFDVA